MTRILKAICSYIGYKISSMFIFIYDFAWAFVLFFIYEAINNPAIDKGRILLWVIEINLLLWIGKKEKKERKALLSMKEKYESEKHRKKKTMALIGSIFVLLSSIIGTNISKSHAEQALSQNERIQEEGSINNQTNILGENQPYEREIFVKPTEGQTIDEADRFEQEGLKTLLQACLAGNSRLTEKSCNEFIVCMNESQVYGRDCKLPEINETQQQKIQNEPEVSVNVGPFSTTVEVAKEIVIKPFKNIANISMTGLQKTPLNRFELINQYPTTPVSGADCAVAIFDIVFIGGFAKRTLSKANKFFSPKGGSKDLVADIVFPATVRGVEDGASFFRGVMNSSIRSIDGVHAINSMTRTSGGRKFLEEGFNGLNILEREKFITQTDMLLKNSISAEKTRIELRSMNGFYSKEVAASKINELNKEANAVSNAMEYFKSQGAETASEGTLEGIVNAVKAKDTTSVYRESAGIREAMRDTGQTATVIYTSELAKSLYEATVEEGIEELNRAEKDFCEIPDDTMD